ncbi:hypothetical protein [Hyphomicrobium sp.]|uniref:hypothetical protein n=1 Tax=Hyphomicrobium sp. TaxID=82 RepID=UPI003F703F5A
MIDVRQKSSVGDTAAEYIVTIPDEIDSDGEGLWKIVPGGRSFGFEGDDLAEFVRLCVLRLLQVGAVPVRHAKMGKLAWAEQTQYGTTRDEIADAIVAEWLEAGGGNPEWSWLWFVTRGVLQTSRRWQADSQKSD